MGTEMLLTPKLRVEFKPLLSVANILLEFPRSVILASPRINIETHTVSIETKEWAAVFCLESLTLKPNTCRGLRWNSEIELHLTLQAELNTGVNKGGDAENFKTQQYNFCNQDLLASKIKECQSQCYCAGCGAQILKSSCNFKRVLPLPSENWADFADIWFCHNHQSDGKTHHHSHHNHSDESTLPGPLRKIKNSGLTPRPDDCLVSSLYMLVSARKVKSCAVLCTTDKIICKRCGNFLGFVKLGDADSGDHNLHSYFHDPLNGVYKLYFHALSFGSNTEDVPGHKLKVSQELDSKQISENTHNQSVEAFICNLLKDQSHLYTSFRFIVDSSCEGEGQSGVLILLWLLDQDLAVFSSSPVSTSRHTSLPSSSSELPVPNLPQVMLSKLVPSHFMKLLYKATFLPLNGSHSIKMSSPPVFTTWQKDNTVHSISLPYPLCKQLVSLLVSSTKQLTRSQRSLNGFHVGYLKVS